MTSEVIIKIAELSWKILDPLVARTISEVEAQEILDTYYNEYGMQEEDLKQAMDQITDDKADEDSLWYEQAERIR